MNLNCLEQTNILVPLVKLLEKPGQTSAILILILRALGKVFWLEMNVCATYRPFYSRFEECNGVEIVNALQHNSNEAVYELAYTLILNYANGEVEDNVN